MFLDPVEYDECGRPTYEWLYDAYVVKRVRIAVLYEILELSSPYMYALIRAYNLPMRIPRRVKARQPSKEDVEYVYTDLSIPLGDALALLDLHSHVELSAWCYAYGIPYRYRHLLTDTDIEDIVNLIDDGETMTAISASYHTSPSTIRAALATVGYAPPSRRWLRKRPTAEAELRNAASRPGATVSSIRDEVGGSIITVEKMLQEFGIPYAKCYRGVKTGWLRKVTTPSELQAMLDSKRSLTDIASAYGKSISTISKTVRRWGLSIPKDEDIVDEDCG